MGYKNLLKPGKIGSMELRNRVIMPGMGTNLAAADGTASDSIINYYARRAEGGVGLVITEVCAPEAEGCVIPGEIEISNRLFMPTLSRIPHAVHAGGGKVALQLAHAGCNASITVTGVRPKSPSGIGTFRLPDENPRVMSIEEIEDLIEVYAQGVARAQICGFDAVEIHGAHGYMPLQFLSGYTNRREDKYGGSLENRARFSLEIIRRSRELVGKKFPIIYRLSAEEFVPNGVTIEESKIVAKWLEEAGVDAINVSAGTWDSRFFDYDAVMKGEESPEGKNLGDGVATSVWVSPNYTPRGTLLDYAKQIRKEVNIPVFGANGITPEMGEDLIANKDLDFVCIGRQIIAEPDLVNKLEAGKPEEIRRCLRCNDCLGEVNKSCGLSCATNPEAGKEYEYYTQVKASEERKKVAIIGSGPAGIQAAITASERGHDVTLYEKEERLGGNLYYVCLPDFKNDYKAYYRYLLNQIETMDIKVKTNVEVTSEMLDKDDFDVVLVATGANTFVPSICGDKGNEILDPLHVLDNNIPEGEEIIVCGAGLVGCEVAMYLAENGKKVTIVDMIDEPAKETSMTVKWVLNSRLAELGIDVKLNHKVQDMSGTHIECIYNDEVVRYDADEVIAAFGLLPNRTLLENLRTKSRRYKIVPIGDVNGARKIINAVHEGFHAARLI